jgi:hypothetical protein
MQRSKVLLIDCLLSFDAYNSTLFISLQLSKSTHISLQRQPLSSLRSDLPRCSFIIVHGDFGSRIVQLYRDELDVFGRVHGSSRWVHVRIVRLLSQVIRRLSKFPAEEQFYRWGIPVFSDGPGFVVLLAQDCERRSRWLFSVDVETMEMKAVTESAYHKTRRTWSYALPWLSSIRECLRVWFFWISIVAF